VKLCENAAGALFAVKICRCSFAQIAQRGGRRGSLRPQAANSLEALKKEISIMKRLDHPNIVKLHYILEDHVKCKVLRAPPLQLNAPPTRTRAQMYMVMDYVEGGSVAHLMTDASGQLRALDEDTARKYVAAALQQRRPPCCSV
jgi:serine/threonine protein kinase